MALILFGPEQAEARADVAEGAATATGTTLTHEVGAGYKNMINNLAMAHRYSHHCEALGVKAPDAPPDMPTGSTDMGDVSHAVPAIHPVFRIADPGAGNCHEERFESIPTHRAPTRR